MNTSAALPLDTAVDGRSHMKDNNYQLEESGFSENSNATTSKCDNFKRYSRYKLLVLRNDSQSRRHPQPDIRAELQSLGVWKFNNVVNTHQNSNTSNSDGITMSNCAGGSKHSVQMSAHMAVRSPSRRDVNSVNITNSFSQHSLSHHNLYKTYIDHRSISSSHLMPAFAKRRIAASTPSTNNITVAGFQNFSGSGNKCYGPNFAVDTRSQTPTDIKEVMIFSGNTNSSNGTERQRTKEQLYDYRHRGNSNEGHKSYLSSQTEIIDSERDREMEIQSNNSRLSSPVAIGSSRQSGILNERRIGSGRLLPRDVNWDYQAMLDRTKNQIVNNVTTADKEILASNFLIQFRSGLRYTDRQHDRIAGVNGYADRRAYECRSDGDDEIVRVKYEYNGNTQSPSSHSSSRRDIYGTEGFLSQHTTHNRIRRIQQNNARNEEPEWFSSGPTSQHDTIELHGFEEIDDRYKGNTTGANGNLKPSIFSSSRKVSESSFSLASSILNLSKSRLREKVEQETKEITCINVSQITLPCTSNKHENIGTNEEEKNKLHDKGDNNGNNNFVNFTRSTSFIESTLEGLEKEGISKNLNNKKVKSRDTEVNFDVFLNPNLDPLTHTLMRGDNTNGSKCDAVGTSRFSRWFGNKSAADEIRISTGTSNEGDSTTLQSVSSESKNDTNTLMDFLKTLPHLQDSGITQKVTAITSVEELEARMREINALKEISSESEKACLDIQSKKEKEMSFETILPINNDRLTTGQPQVEEVEAFKKLLEQLGSGNKQQKYIEPQQHVPPNMQINVMVSQQNRSVPIPPLNKMQPGSILPLIPQPQPMILKNDELKKIVHPQVFRQKLPNNSDNNMSQSQPIHLLMFGNHPQKHLEAQNRYQCIQRGEISIHFLEQEMNNPGTPLQAKEATSAALRDYSNMQNQQISKSAPTGYKQQQHSPIPVCNSRGTQIQNHGATNPLNEQLPQQQLLLQVPNANVMLPGKSDRASLLPTQQSSNHQVIPSQQDLQFHTHTIMQNAMIKKKIEEQQLQQDSHRRRKDIQRQSQPNSILIGQIETNMKQKNMKLSNNMQQQQPSTGTQQHISHTMQHQQRHISSPTPLAFTPTSVLRKMTAEKDNVVIQQQSKTIASNFQTNQRNIQQPVATQPRMILGGSHSQQPQQMSSSNQLSPQSLAQAPQQQPIQPLRNSITAMKWPLNLVNQNMPSIKPMGRPILKGPSIHPQSSSQLHQSQQQMPQISQMMFNKLDFQQIQQQQQQRMKSNLCSQHVLNQPIPPFSSAHSNIMSQVHQQQIYQQQRVLTLQRHQHQQFHLPQQLQHQQHPPLDAPNHNICMQPAMTSDNNAVVNIINYQQDGVLSPTSNQLAQWFSPDLLAQASAGKLPLLNMNQTLSLEEFERNIQHSSTTA